MAKYKLYTFVNENLNITEHEINDDELLKYFNYKIGVKFRFTPCDDCEYAGQICEIVDYVKYDEDDWCYNVKFNNGQEQRIYESELELITANS